MGIVSRAADIYYTYRFIKTLTTDWVDTDAYKLGLIDADGKSIKKPVTQDEKDAYTVFYRLAFNIKRILEKLPFGKSRLVSYAAALFLLKEHSGMSEEQVAHALSEANIDIADLLSEKTSWHVLGDSSLSPGAYTLTQDIASPLTGLMIARKGTIVNVAEGTMPIGSMFGENVYSVRHTLTSQDIYISSGDITK